MQTMAFGRVFFVLSGTVFMTAAGILAAARARWSLAGAPVDAEDLSALAVAALATLAATAVAMRNQLFNPVRPRAGDVFREVLDAALVASALLLALWIEIVQPLGLRSGIAILSYTVVGLTVAAAFWRLAQPKLMLRPAFRLVVPYVIALAAAGAFGVTALTGNRGIDSLNLGMAVAMAALLVVRQLLVVIENARLTSHLGAAQQELMFRSEHDPLTNLPNRALFRRHLEYALSRRRRRSRESICAVIFVDIDDFKNVNDKIGHAGGDRVLVEIARRLRDTMRSADTVARLGGDEFGVLFEQVGAAGDLLDVAQRLVEDLNMPLVIDGTEVTVQATVGVALHGPAEPAADAGELLRRADVALRLAKQRGKGTFGVFETSMHVALDQPRQRRSGIERALGLREFVLHYQPIVDVRQRTLVGAEALIRWAHPEAGVLGPNEFLTDLEDVGLIGEVGRWVIEEAVAEASTLRAGLGVDFFVTVNVSSVQLHDPSFVDHVRSILAVSGLPSSALVIELTESGSVADDQVALGRLRALRALGVRLAIDDFGTGYSSMAYLHRFPVDVLKIDKSFIDDLVEESPDRRLAEELTRLGTSLGVLTIAEGVETEDQHRALEALNCPLAQGFFYGGALPKEHLAIALRAAGKPLRTVSRRTA